MRNLIAFLMGLALLPIWPESGEAAQLPALPQSFIDTTYSPPSGSTITVNAGGNLQAALNSAALGQTIVLQAGATFTGPFTLPNKAGSGWIYIRSSAYSSLPAPGNRVSPSDAPNMPKIVVAVTASEAAITTASGAHHYRFVGIEITPVGGGVFEMVSISNGTSDIVFDRCYVHGHPTQDTRRGLNLNATRAAVIDSHVSDFRWDGGDTQAVLGFNTPGPVKIVNNHLSATSENVMFGGVDPTVNGLVPSDIEIRRNHFFKPMSWRGGPYDMKNLLEFKNARRVLVEGNLFENNWADSQIGFAIVITPRNESGVATWSTAEDITIRNNIIRNSASGFVIGGEDTGFASQTTRRVAIQNNVIELNRTLGGDGKLFQIAAYTGPPQDITIEHNTGLITGSGGTTAFVVNIPRSNSLDFINNLFSRGQLGFSGEGTAEGTASLNAYFTTWNFARNAIIGAIQNVYPANNFFPANTAAVMFVDFAGGNYRLSASSPYKNQATDGKDVGADINAIEAAMAASGIVAPQNLRFKP